MGLAAAAVLLGSTRLLALALRPSGPMYPWLGQIPWGDWSLPMAPGASVLAALGILALLVGWWTKRLGLLAAGTLVAAPALGFAWFLRGNRYQASPLLLPSYGVALALACFVVWQWSARRGPREGLSAPDVRVVLSATGIGALLGGRVVYVLAQGEPWREIVAWGSGGLSGAGACWGGLALAGATCRWRRMSFLSFLDAAAPALAFGIVVVRLGCYLHGCDFGPPLGEGAPAWLERFGTFPRWESPSPLGAGPPVWTHHVALGWLPGESTASLPVHPTQLYEALLGIGLLAACWGLSGRLRFRGARGLLAVGGYAWAAVLLGPLHADPERGGAWLFAMLGVVCAAVWWLRDREVALR